MAVIGSCWQKTDLVVDIPVNIRDGE